MRLEVGWMRLEVGACQDMRLEAGDCQDMRLEVRIVYTGHEARCPHHIYWRKLSMTVLNLIVVITMFQKVKQTEYNSIGQ